MIGNISTPGGIRPVRFGAGIGAIGGDTYRQAVINTGPISYWRLGEASGTFARDEMGANPGTYVGGPSLGVPGLVAGDADTAVVFTGASTMGVNLASDAFMPSGAGSRTLVAWISPTAVAVNPALFLWGTGAGQFCWVGLIGASLRCYDGSTTRTLATGITATPQMLAAVYDGANWTAYVNGVAQAPIAQTLATTLGGPLKLFHDTGAYQVSSLPGAGDEPAIWNRALSAAEVAALNAIGRGTW